MARLNKPWAEFWLLSLEGANERELHGKQLSEAINLEDLFLLFQKRLMEEWDMSWTDGREDPRFE